MKASSPPNPRRRLVNRFVIGSSVLLLVVAGGVAWIVYQEIGPPDPNNIPVYPGAQHIEPLLTDDFGAGFNMERMRQFSYDVEAEPQMIRDFYKQSLASTRWYESSPGNENTMIFGWAGPLNNRAGEVSYSLLIYTEVGQKGLTRVKVALIKNVADCC